MAYVITDGCGYLAGKQIYRDPEDRRKIIALWSSLESDAMLFNMRPAAEHMLRKLDKPELRIATL